MDLIITASCRGRRGRVQFSFSYYTFVSSQMMDSPQRGHSVTTGAALYTRNGDGGMSRLFTGEKRRKTDLVFEAMGTIDELCCMIGAAHAESMASAVNQDRLSEPLLDIMSRLFDCGSHIAKPPVTDSDVTVGVDGDFDNRSVGASAGSLGIGDEHVQRLEEWIDNMTIELPGLASFILPSGGRTSVQLHIARAVCRRAERRVAGLVQDSACSPVVLRYLNRLSDFLFAAARWSNYREGHEEIRYQRSSNEDV
jgi:ATP:cob(I)alamin adenosyltransferase